MNRMNTMTSLEQRMSRMTEAMNNKLILEPSEPSEPSKPSKPSDPSKPSEPTTAPSLEPFPSDPSSEPYPLPAPDKDNLSHPRTRVNVSSPMDILDSEGNLLSPSYDDNSADTWSDCGDCSSVSSDSDYDKLVLEPYEEEESDIDKNKNSISRFWSRCCFPNTETPEFRTMGHC